MKPGLSRLKSHSLAFALFRFPKRISIAVLCRLCNTWITVFFCRARIWFSKSAFCQKWRADFNGTIYIAIGSAEAGFLVPFGAITSIINRRPNLYRVNSSIGGFESCLGAVKALYRLCRRFSEQNRWLIRIWTYDLFFSEKTVEHQPTYTHNTWHKILFLAKWFYNFLCKKT